MARRFISSYLSEYFLNLNTKTLSLSFWSGYLNCENLKLNPRKFNENKNLPIHLKDGVISKINMSLPIKSFFLGINNDIEITIEDVDINLITNSDFEFFDYTNFDYKYSYIKGITDDLLFKMELSKNPNFNDTYLTRSINYFLRNMKITVKNIRVKLIHGTNEVYNDVFCANIDYINLKKDSCIIDKFYIYTENINNANHIIRKKGHDYILFPLTIKSQITLLKKSESDINTKENIENSNNENNKDNNNNLKDIETYYVDFELDEINFSIHKEQFILIMNLINFFIDYGNFYNNCFILRKIQYKKPKKENNNIINNNAESNNENDDKNKENKEGNKNYYFLLLKHYIKGLILIFKEKKFNIDVFDYYKDLNTERKKTFQTKFNDFFFKNKKDEEMVDIIRFTDEDVLKKWIEEMCDSIYKYQKESAQGFFSGIKSYFFSSALEGMEISNLEEVSSRQKIICEFKGNINIVTLSLKNYNEEIKLSILENEINFFRGRINEVLETRIGKVKLSFKHLINKSIFTREIILPLVNDNENKEIYIKYIFKNFIPKTVNEKSNLTVKCTSHVFIYNHSMFHSLYQFLYKDVTFMNKNFTHYKLFLRISNYKFDKESKVDLNVNIANQKVIFPYLNYDYLNYYNDEKLEINFGDLDLKSTEQYDILVENISVDFIDRNLITHPIIKNFNLILKSSFDFNNNNLKLKNIEIQASIYLLQTLLFKTKNLSESSKPENIWKIKNKNKNHIHNNAIKKGYLYYVNKDDIRIKYYALISGGYIYLFRSSENSNPEFLIPLYDSFLEEKFYNNKYFGFNLIYGGKNSNGNQYNNIYEINFNTKEEMVEWKNSIDYRIEEINKSLINIKIKQKRKLSDPNQNNINNSNINLNDEKEIDIKTNLKYSNYYSQLILEESKRIRNNIKNKFEDNQQKKLRMYLDQIMKFVNSSKGNRHFTSEIENISLLLNYSENEKNYDKGCKIVLNNTKIEYIENNIFFIIQFYLGNIKFISNNINLIQVHDNLEENLDLNCFLNCNILVCYDSSYLLLDKNRDKLLKLIPNIKKREEIEEFILRVKTNQIKLNIFKELDISFQSDEIFMNIKLIKDFFKRIKRKFDETIQINNKINLNINAEKNISLIHYDELNKSKYYLIIKKICSKENKTILKDVHLMNIEIENKNNKKILKEFDVIIKDSLFEKKLIYDIEFASDIACYLDKNDFDNIYNIINDIRYTFKNNFSRNNNKIKNSNRNNNFQRTFKMKIKKLEINFIISSIFRTKNYNEIKLILNNIIINKEKSNNYIYIADELVLLRNLKNNNNILKNINNETEILIKIPKSYNAIYISYENIKKDKMKLLDLVIDKIILNFQYELLYDFLNFFVNIKYNNSYYQNRNNKDVFNNNLETNSNLQINSSFSNNTILSINNTMNGGNNIKENKNIDSFQIIKEIKSPNSIDNFDDLITNESINSLLINLNINSFLLKVPVKQQKNNIIIQNELNESLIGNNLEEEEEDEENKKVQTEYFCIEFISVLMEYNTDLIENNRSLPYKSYLKFNSPENKIFIITQEIEKREKIFPLSNNFSFYIEIKYDYSVHKELFIPQKKFSFYFYFPEELNINLNFEQLKSFVNVLVDIKNYYQESKLTYFTYCYLAEPEIYTTLKTLFFEICGHIYQKLTIRIEEFFEIIIKNLNFSYNDATQEMNNQEINISFALIIKYYNRNIKKYELFLEKYNFKFTALNNYFKFGSDDTSLIELSDNEEENKIINENEYIKENNNNIINENEDEFKFDDKNETMIEKNNNPNGLSLNITVELLYIINNIYDIFMLYKKCHVLQNTQNQNNLNIKNNNKTLLIYFHNYTTENIKINKLHEIKEGEFLKYKINSKNEELLEIKFTKSNIQYNEIKLNQIQHTIIYNKIYFLSDNINKYYFVYPIICKSFCQKDITITNFTNEQEKLLITNKIQGLAIESFKNRTIIFKLNDNMLISVNEHLINKVKNYLINSEKNNREKTKFILKDYFILKFDFIHGTNNVIKMELYPRYLILNTLNIPIIFYGILNKNHDMNKKLIETELNIDGKLTDIYYPDLPQLLFRLKIIDNEVKNGNNEFISEISTLNNYDFDDSFNDDEQNQINEINNIDINTSNLFNSNNFGFIENKSNKTLNGKIKVIFKSSEDLVIKIIYHTIPETKQIKLYIYMDYFILNNTKLNIYPLNNCISFNDKNFMVNYYPLKNFKNFQLVVSDKIVDKFEIKKEDYAFFTHIEVDIANDKKINLLVQRHLRYIKLGEKLYKIDFLIISQIQKSNIDNNNNINNIVVNSNKIDKIKNHQNDIENEKNQNTNNDDDILMKLVKQRNFKDLPEVNDIKLKFSFQVNFPSIFIILIANNKNDNLKYKNEFEFGSRYEIASICLDNIDFIFSKEKIIFKKENNQLEEDDTISNININNIQNNFNKNNQIISDFDLSNKTNDILEDIEDIYNNNIELTIQSIQIDNLLQNVIYKIIFYNKKEYKNLLLPFKDKSYNFKNNYLDWLGIPLLTEKNKINNNINEEQNNNINNNRLLPFIHFKGSFINQEYKYYFKDINICFLPCYLYLDSEFSSELFLFISESYNIFKNKNLYYSQSIKEIIESLRFNLDSNFSSKFFMFISSFKVSPLNIIFNYKNFSNRFFNLLNLQSNFINTLLDVFTNNTTSIKFQFNSIVLYDINVRFNALLYKLYDYYYYTFLRECIKIIFSVDLLGDPYHLISHLSEGISNFITLPILSIFNGPSDFIFYLLYGTKSLLSNSIGGLLDSLHKFTNSISKNILKLTSSEDYIKSRNKILIKENYLDENSINYLENNKKKRNYNKNSNGFNLVLISKILGNGMKYGFKDLIVIPYKYYQNNGVIEIPIGIILGTISLIVKPISATMDSISILSNSISHEILKGEKNYEIDEDYLYYTYSKKRHRRELFNDNKEIRRYKEENIDILLKLIGDCFNIDNEIERGIINGNYYIDKLFITKYSINNDDGLKNSKETLFNIDNEINDTKNRKTEKENEEQIENYFIMSFTVIAFIKNLKNNEFSIMIYIININRNKIGRKFELFKNKKKNEKNYKISMNLQNIIPCKDIISLNYNKNEENIILLYQKERKNENIDKNKMITLLKYNHFANLYGCIYFNKEKAYININFSSKYILNEFLDYYSKIKYNKNK